MRLRIRIPCQMAILVLQRAVSQREELLAVLLVAVETAGTAETGVDHAADACVVAQGELGHFGTQFYDYAD
jgi:hypothetical protein